eukprot:scaffold101188_cov67-Phaeocystis_antarctica.AAC.7
MIFHQPGARSAEPSGLLSVPCARCVESPRIMPLVPREARRSWRCATGGAECTRSSLLTVQMDAAPVSTAAVASSRPREDAEGPHPPWNGPKLSFAEYGTCISTIFFSRNPCACPCAASAGSARPVRPVRPVQPVASPVPARGARNLEEVRRLGSCGVLFKVGAARHEYVDGGSEGDEAQRGALGHPGRHVQAGDVAAQMERRDALWNHLDRNRDNRRNDLQRAQENLGVVDR